MSYNPDIPQDTDIPAQSQGQILINFQQLNTVFSEDHVPFNDATTANRGKHEKSTYRELADSPGTIADEIAVYSREVLGITRLFLQQEGVAAGQPDVQLSNRNPDVAASGETFLPGGLLLKWGSLVVATSPTAVLYASFFPTASFSVVVTINNDVPGFSATVNSAGVSGFDLYTTKTGVTHFYFAIGN